MRLLTLEALDLIDAVTKIELDILKNWHRQDIVNEERLYSKGAYIMQVTIESTHVVDLTVGTIIKYVAKIIVLTTNSEDKMEYESNAYGSPADALVELKRHIWNNAFRDFLGLNLGRYVTGERK